MADERAYIVTYDIADARRWRTIFRLMQGHGEWLQLSVFQCRLTRAQALELRAELEQAISATEDHVMMVDLGPADSVQPQVVSLGKRRFVAIERDPVIV